jgi:cytochrome c553
MGFGTVMADVARRFELFGRAASSGRYALAEYELGEIEELFTETLPHAAPPKEGHPEVLPTEIERFTQTNVPDLRRSVQTHDATQVKLAFARAATACNACHQASGHEFIEVPLVPGQSIPNTGPLLAH